LAQTSPFDECNAGPCPFLQKPEYPKIIHLFTILAIVKNKSPQHKQPREVHSSMKIGVIKKTIIIMDINVKSPTLDEIWSKNVFISGG
jgi:hypothetical protein